MDEFVRNLLENTSGGFAYGLVFAVLLACGLGVPLPEDVSLIFGGLLVYQGNARLLPMMATGLIGILVGDSLIYFAGSRFGSSVGERPHGLIGRVITPEKLAKVRKLFAKHGEKIVFLARFLPGVRAVTFFTAGSAHMRYMRFLSFDGVAALVSAPLFVFLGYEFGGELETLIIKVRRGQARVLIVLAAVLALYALYTWWRKRREKVAEVPGDTAAPGSKVP